jgi:hypothetical protein
MFARNKGTSAARILALTLGLALTILCLTLPLSLAQKGGRSARSSSSKSSSKSSTSKTVHVKGYTRKDGTYVPPYDRAAPGTASSTGSSNSRSSTRSTNPEKSDGVFTSSRSRTIRSEQDKHGKIKRSEVAKHEFMLAHPCPVTGLTSRKCPGYVIDHVNPLACGGLDAPSNMQWQTKADAKAKDKSERKGCR